MSIENCRNPLFSFFINICQIVKCSIKDFFTDKILIFILFFIIKNFKSKYLFKIISTIAKIIQCDQLSDNIAFFFEYLNISKRV